MKKVTVYQALDGSTFNNERDCLDYENQFPGHRLVSVLKEIWDSLSNGGRGGFQATVHANGVEWNTGNLPDNPDDTYIDFDDCGFHNRQLRRGCGTLDRSSFCQT